MPAGTVNAERHDRTLSLKDTKGTKDRGISLVPLVPRSFSPHPAILCYNSRVMKRVLRILGRTLGLVVVLGLLAFGWLAWQVDAQGREDDARPADTIVVLGAVVEPNGQPGPDLSSRTRHAVDLWRGGYAPQIICTGGFRDEPLSAAAVCRRTAAELGVPLNRLWLADGSQNTMEDAAATQAVMAAHGWRSAIVVSHPLHVFRARWLFRRAGIVAVTSPTNTQTDRIAPPYRVWYALREAGAVVVTSLTSRGWLPANVTARLQAWSYSTRNP